jgi:hypothetical protein
MQKEGWVDANGKILDANGPRDKGDRIVGELMGEAASVPSVAEAPDLPSVPTVTEAPQDIVEILTGTEDGQHAGADDGSIWKNDDGKFVRVQ